MRHLIAILLFVTALPLFAGTRSHIVNTTDRTRMEIVQESNGDSYATFERDGVRYITRDPRVLEDLAEAYAEQREISRDHAELGRRHAALGREHAALGREHARIGREHARLHHRTGDYEERQRALEELQRKLDRKQQELERRQQELEREQRELERRQNAVDRKADKDVEKIFERAIRDGKAQRD
jgi:chromosome segregation ATPase